MSGRNAVIEGSYADFKLVKTRGVAQLVIEIPIERAAEAVAMFGIPQPGQEIAVAIARLVEIGDDEQPVQHDVITKPLQSPDKIAAAPAKTAGRTSPQDPVKSERGKAAFRAKPEMEKDVTRAAMLVKDVDFQDWLTTGRVTTAEECDKVLKATLGISSKKELATDAAANARFRALVTDFEMATGRAAVPVR